MGSTARQPATLVALLLFVLLALASGKQMEWQACEGSEPSGITAYKVTLTPDPPNIGSPATFTISANSGRWPIQQIRVGARVLRPHTHSRSIHPPGISMSMGTVDIVVSFAGLDIFSQSEDLW